LIVRHVAESAGQVRRYLVDDLVRRGLSSVAIENAALLMTELITNAVRYASPLPGGVVQVAWELTSHGLLMRVTDGGGWVAPRRQAAGPRDTRGRGLAIVEALAARWGVERTVDQMSTVWAELPLGFAGSNAGGCDRGPHPRPGSPPSNA
jgi:anti-sigma regulatory factor (Ser/Thr protein kinase)